MQPTVHRYNSRLSIERRRKRVFFGRNPLIAATRRCRPIRSTCCKPINIDPACPPPSIRAATVSAGCGVRKPEKEKAAERNRNRHAIGGNHLGIPMYRVSSKSWRGKSEKEKKRKESITLFLKNFLQTLLYLLSTFNFPFEGSIFHKKKKRKCSLHIISNNIGYNRV